MPSCDEDAEHTIGRAATFRKTLDHNMLYVSGENLKLRPFHTTPPPPPCHTYQGLYCHINMQYTTDAQVGLCNYGGLIDTLFTDVEGVA
jgi:hypothetical protein